MKRLTTLAHEFVEVIPDKLEQGKLHISIQFATVAHLCCCGCGMDVVTPLSPTDWSLIFDGETISLDPSIGNWGFPCQSHYWIKRSTVVWAPRWTRREVRAGRARDRAAKEKYFDVGVRDQESPSGGKAGRPERNLWWRLKTRLTRRP